MLLDGPLGGVSVTEAEAPVVGGGGVSAAVAEAADAAVTEAADAAVAEAADVVAEVESAVREC